MSNCTKCDGPTFVKDSRKYDLGLIRRRRECERCGHRHSTLELPCDFDVNSADVVRWATEIVTETIRNKPR